MVLIIAGILADAEARRAAQSGANVGICALKDSRSAAKKREADRCRPATNRVRCATVSTRQNDPLAETVVLPDDELAARRRRRLETPPVGSIERIRRLLAAHELRRRAERDD